MPSEKAPVADKSELILFNDAALRRDAAVDGDVFALDRKLKPIYEAILSKTTETPFSVMISGGWGTGKTSSMRWLDEHLRASGNGKGNSLKVDTCWFYPWKYQDREDVWKGLIAEVILESIKFENVDTEKVLKAARQFGKFLGGSFVRVLSSVKLKAGVEADVEKALTGIIEEYGKHVTPQDAYYNVFEKALEEWVGQCYKKDKSRLVIFIDDLDRCLPAIALQVLEAIKLYLNIPNLVVIVGVDRQVIDAVVLKHYEDCLGGMAADEIRPKARQYLDKMFQVEVPISPRDEQVAAYIETQLERTSLWKLISKTQRIIFGGIIREIADINPRAVVRALNTAIVGAESETNALLVGQSMQRALITTVLQKLPESKFGQVHDLCLREQGRDFFRQWSRQVVADPAMPQYLTEQELAEPVAAVGRGDSVLEAAAASLRKRHKQTAESREPGESGAEPGDDAPNPLVQLAVSYPDYKRLLTVRTLGLLMRIPFAEESAAEVEPAVAVDKAAAEAPEDIDWTPLIKLVAEQRRVGVDQVSRESLLAETGLDLSYNTIPEAAWPPIGAWSNLAKLNLSHAGVTDAGLAHLSGLSGLQVLDLDGTGVTDAGLVHLNGLSGLQGLDLDGTRVTDAGLAHLSGLSGLQMLDLSGMGVTDAGLAHLSGLSDLQVLELHDTGVTDAGLAYLSGLSGLRELYLGGTGVTDAGLAHLSGLSGLQVLHLDGTGVTGEGLAYLGGLFGLQTLYLNGTRLTDAGLAHLSSLSGLQTLDLSGTGVTDAELAHLSGLTGLQWLDLTGTGVTDAGLADLKGLSGLQVLGLRATGVTDAGIADLEKSLRNCQLHGP